MEKVKRDLMQMLSVYRNWYTSIFLTLCKGSVIEFAPRASQYDASNAAI